MGREQRNNDGALFKNDRKQSENHPDYTGSAVIDGVEYWVSAWVKTSQAGKKFFSMAYKPKEEGGYGAGGQRRRAESQARSAPEPQRGGGYRPARFDDSEETLPF